MITVILLLTLFATSAEARTLHPKLIQGNYCQVVTRHGVRIGPVEDFYRTEATDPYEAQEECGAKAFRGTTSVEDWLRIEPDRVERHEFHCLLKRLRMVGRTRITPSDWTPVFEGTYDCAAEDTKGSTVLRINVERGGGLTVRTIKPYVPKRAFPR
jgi:hypothetical protein